MTESLTLIDIRGMKSVNSIFCIKWPKPECSVAFFPRKRIKNAQRRRLCKNQFEGKIAGNEIKTTL